MTFYQLIRQAGAPHMQPPRLPERATPDAGGILPAKAYRYCEAVRQANAYGYHLYVPMDIGLRFDGAGFACSIDEDGTGAGHNWWPLEGSAHFPGFVDIFNAMAPEYLHNLVPPLITPGETHGIVQIWTGTIAHTRPGWSLLVRAPVHENRRPLGYEVIDGIIETDRWGGHLFANIRVFRTDKPILLRAHQPFVQAVPVHRAHYGDDLLNHFQVRCDTVPDDVWHRYGDVVVGKADGTRLLGAYAVAVRRRRAAEK
nr:DUF6065 family protein [uncultured Rhodopila sp.]